MKDDRSCYFYTKRQRGGVDKESEERKNMLGFCKSNLDDERLVSIWRSMREYGPVWMNLQPCMAMLLARIIEKYDLEQIPTLRYVETTGEMLFPEARAYICDMLNVTVADQYGCNEMNSIAYECPCGKLHIMEENVYVEILGKNGKQVPDDEEGDIVVTTLTNYSMPLIRYKIGDRGRIISCDCFLANLWQDSLRNAKIRFEVTDKLFPDVDSGKLGWFRNELFFHC